MRPMPAPQSAATSARARRRSASATFSRKTALSRISTGDTCGKPCRARGRAARAAASHARARSELPGPAAVAQGAHPKHAVHARLHARPVVQPLGVPLRPLAAACSTSELSFPHLAHGGELAPLRVVALQLLQRGGRGAGAGGRHRGTRGRLRAGTGWVQKFVVTSRGVARVFELRTLLAKLKNKRVLGANRVHSSGLPTIPSDKLCPVCASDARACDVRRHALHRRRARRLLVVHVVARHLVVLQRRGVAAGGHVRGERG